MSEGGGWCANKTVQRKSPKRYTLSPDDPKTSMVEIRMAKGAFSIRSLFCECCIAIYTNMAMFITIEDRNLGIRKHVKTFCSGTKPFYQLWVKGFDIRRRDTIFYAVLFIWPPSRAASIGRKFASRLRAPKVDLSRLASSTQLSLSSDSHTNLHALPVRDVTCSLSPRFVSDYYGIWVTPPSVRARPLARVNTCHNVAPN